MRYLRKIILIIFLLGAPNAYGQGAASAEAVKAAFILHFLNYTRWDDDLDHYNVCIPRDEYLRLVTRESLEGRIVNGRSINVVNRAWSCHVLVASPPSNSDNTLTIGSLSEGALLEFRVVNNKLRFAANVDRIKNSKLKISSQLLKLAIVEERKS